MKIAILGGKTLLDAIFLNMLSEEYQNLSVECYGESGEISFGSKILSIRPIAKFNAQDVDVIINFSEKYAELNEIIMQSNAKYLNYHVGKPVISSLNFNVLQKNIIIPDYSIAVCEILRLFKKYVIKNLNITTFQPIAELGKEGLNLFHREIKESLMQVIRKSDDKDALAFNVSLIGTNLASQIKEILDIEANVVSFRSCVNKSNIIILNFELSKDVDRITLINIMEKAGISYCTQNISSILTENDDQIYVMDLRKNEKQFSLVLMYDSVRHTVFNIIDFLKKIIIQKL